MNKTRYKWKTPELSTPYLSRTNESLFMFQHNQKQMSVFGIGRVIKVQQGKQADIVYLDVGRGYRLDYCKKLIVMTDLARKQIFTLVHRQYTMFYGVKEKKNHGIYALAFFPTYVPKVCDRNLILEEANGDLGFEAISEEQENKDKDIQDFLTQFERK